MRRIREGLKRSGVEPETPVREGLVWIVEEDPKRWLARFGGALLAGQSVALGAHQMSVAEYGERAKMIEAWTGAPKGVADPAILIPTGGTSGKLRWAVHRWSTLIAAAEGFLQYFGTAAGACVCVLPLHHVGGLMSVVRAWEADETVWFGSYRDLSGDLAIPPGATVSLVPTQLTRLLEDSYATENLRRAGRILIGGAHLDEATCERARAEKLRLAPCYGSTETAALVTALPPFRFLAGQSGVGRPLPHVEICWRENAAAKERHPEARRLGLRSDAVCEGYWPPEPTFERFPWWTSDAGIVDADDNLHILGRIDRVIISGGENVDAERIELLLHDLLPGVLEWTVVDLPDPEWGQRVVAAIVPDPKEPPPTREVLDAIARVHLSVAERPKAWYRVAQLPRTPMGKIDLHRLRESVQLKERGDSPPSSHSS
jgi:O-succinylbenzoic acid--CoA ligase